MNSTSYLISSILGKNETSIMLLKSQMGAFIAYIIFGSVNIIAAILIISTIAIWKPLHSHTQFFAVNLAFCEIGISLCGIGTAINHLYNIYFEIPEVMLQTTCFKQAVSQYMFMLLVPSFHVVLSFDRFISALFPFIYRKRGDFYSLVVACIVWIISPCVTASLYSSVSYNITVVECVARLAINANASQMYVITEISLSLLSLSLSATLMIVLQIQIKKSGGTNGNITEIGKRMKNQATQCVAIIALFNFLSYTCSLLISLAVYHLSSNPESVGLYFNVLYSLGGVYSFIVYFQCQKRFREGFYYLLTKIRINSNNTVSVI